MKLTKKFLVCIAKKHTKEVVEWIEVSAADWTAAVNLAFDTRPQYNGNTHYGDAIEI